MAKRNATVITGVGVICPQGIEKDAFYHHYLADSDAKIAQKTVLFFAQEYTCAIYDFPAVDEQSIPSALRRRMSPLSRLSVVSAWRCLQDSGLDYSKYRDSMGIVIGTGWGEVDSLSTLLMQATEETDISVSPTLFHTSVHNAPAGYLGIILEAKGPTLTVPQGDHSFESALAVGNLLLQSGQCPVVLVGGGDTFFDFAVLEKEIDNNAHAAISRGSCFLLLESEEAAEARNASMRARSVFLPCRTLQNAEDIDEYALEIKKILDEQCSAVGEPIDLVLFTGSIQPSLWHLETDLLKAILAGNSVYLIPPREHLARPTQNAEEFIGALAILQEQKVPSKNLMRLHNNVLEKVDTFAGKIKKILLISVSAQGSHRLFLWEKTQ
jgi:hypothetical protein